MADFSRTPKMEIEPKEVMDTEREQDVTENKQDKGGSEMKDRARTASVETAEDPFKKPALITAPSIASKKTAATVTCAARKISPECRDSTLQDTSEALDDKEKSGVPAEGESQSNEDSLTDLENGDVTLRRTSPHVSAKERAPDTNDNGCVTAKASNPVKYRFPVKPPPGGKFKPNPPLPYTEPPWGGLSETPYLFEIIKNGAIVDTVPLTQSSFFVIGRLPVCDVSLEHPSISRYHAVIQYRRRSGEERVVGEEAGFYAYDLGSTHGTFVNKNKIPPKTYIRLRVGHVLKFGGSTRLFILQGPEFDEEAESELSVTELREQARKQRELLEKRMMGDGSDGEEEEGESETPSSARSSNEEAGCSWGMEEEALPEEDENEENPFSVEFQEDQEAAYLKDPKKALQGFYDREGEELEYEYDDRGHGTWLCRVKLPVDDALGRQLVAEVTHVGKKKEAAIQCSLEACRILEARGLLRQEAVSRKRRKKNWEEEDFYDSDDDTFLDRTGAVEKKRKERMKRAGKIEDRPDTYETLVGKLSQVEKELAETEGKLSASAKGGSQSAPEDPLDAFMSAVRSESSLDGVERRKLHVHAAELRREGQRLRRLVELTRPAQLPTLQSGSEGKSGEPEKPAKPSLPLFGAMKGGRKFKLKTGTIGKLPTKRADLPPELFNMKKLPGEVEEEEEEEEEDDKDPSSPRVETEQSSQEVAGERLSPVRQEGGSPRSPVASGRTESKGLLKPKSDGPVGQQLGLHAGETSMPSPGPKGEGGEAALTPTDQKKKEKKKVYGPKRPPAALSTSYPDDDPDYCVWVPPAGQSGDGRTHLNEKFGY